jgi:polyribonucleotide nucleotidyltransferase
VKTIMPYGAFVEVFPGTDGLLHVSELDWKRIERVEDVLKEGEMIDFQVVGKDPRTGKLKLSRRCCCRSPKATWSANPYGRRSAARSAPAATIGTVRAATGDPH